MKQRKQRPIGVDLFSGAGGFSLGFEQAGFDVVGAVELDPIHAATHKFNFPECATICGSVRDLTGADIRAHAGLGEAEVDVVFGGAPCQGFSLIGQRALDDPRNSLAREFVRLVSELDSNYFVFENVKGLTVGPHRQFLEELVQEFEEAGYRSLLPWRVLNAARFGVPQHRERLFLLGAKTDLPLPNYPEETVVPAGSGECPMTGLLGPSCLDALGDLPEAEDYGELWETDEVECFDYSAPSPYAKGMRCLDTAHWFFGHPRNWNPNFLTSSTRTRHTEISRKRFRETPPGDTEPISRFFKLPPHGVSNTLRAGTDSARGAFTSPRPIHYAKDRCVTVREMARLHGFPDWFRFHRTKWHGARQIGNAVAPPIARLIAGQILEATGCEPRRSERLLDLENAALLGFDMKQASAHWGVPIPIKNRDRKSGLRKRKQVEIELERLAF